jgi:aminomethyltransferase
VDLFVPLDALPSIARRLAEAVRGVGGGLAGWEALEWLRIEDGIPRFGQDMTDANLVLECGIEQRAVRYNKGCYIGQEVINRIHSMGQVTRSLRGLLLPGDWRSLPEPGTRLLHEGKPVGYVTSAVRSPALDRPVALGYVRREAAQAGTRLQLPIHGGECFAVVVTLPLTDYSQRH